MNKEEIIAKIKKAEQDLLSSYMGTPHYRDTLKYIYKLNEQLMYQKSTLKTNKIDKEIRKSGGVYRFGEGGFYGR